MSLLGSFGRSAHTRVWVVLDGLRSKELNWPIMNVVDMNGFHAGSSHKKAHV